MKELTSVFIISSPRHFVLACAIAENAIQFSSSILIISDDFNGSPVFYQIIKELTKKGQSPFSNIFMLSKKYAIKEEPHFFKRLFLKKTREYRQLKLYRKLVKKYEINNIITSEVNSLTTQYFLAKINQQNSVQCHYLEDGLFSYIERPIKQVSALEVFFNRIKYGFNYQKPAAVGSPNWVSVAWLLNPAFAIATIKQKETLQIKLAWFDTNFMQVLSSKFLNHFQLRVKDVQSLDVLVILDVRREMKKLNQDYDKELFYFIQKVLSQGKRVAIKGHPRDSQQLLGLPDKVIEISKALPAEFLLPFLAEEIHLVGDFSTVFVDLKRLKPCVVMHVVQTDKKDTVFNQFFKTQGVDVIANYMVIAEDYR